MNEILRQVWLAVRPITAQQRFLWWCGALMVASGAVHAVVAVADWGPWWGAVSWRKPVVFGMSFGILAWSAVWVLRQLPARRWGWLPTGLLGAGSVVEVALITMQRWRGEASHFNYRTGLDTAVWSVMSKAIILVALAVAVLLVWSLVRFEGTPAARIAVVVGLSAILASGYIGYDIAALGEAAAAATGQAPDKIVFGAAGSAKLAHALGMHGLQVLGLLAIGLGLRPLPTRTQVAVDGPRGRRLCVGVRGRDRHRVCRPGLDLAHRSAGAAYPGRSRGRAGRLRRGGKAAPARRWAAARWRDEVTP